LTRRRVFLTSGTTVCSECGLLWSEVDWRALLQTVDQWGEDYLKDFLGLAEAKKPAPGADELA
jgi:hypothetical protein